MTQPITIIHPNYPDESLFIIGGRYPYGGQPYLQLVTETGEPMYVATVNLPEYSDVLPPKMGRTEYAFIKTWSENEGLLEVLKQAGIVVPSGLTVSTGYVETHIVVLCVEIPRQARILTEQDRI